MKERSNEQVSPGYRIGAVSKLTRIPTDTLRVWERRYNVVEPSRSEGGGRLYSQEDINRLGAIKKLVESGHAIGTVANLTIDELDSRLTSIAGSVSMSAEPEDCRLAVIGETLSQRFSNEIASSSGILLAGSFRTPEEFGDASFDQAPNMLAIECPTLHESTAVEVRRLFRESRARFCIIVYSYASNTVISDLEAGGLTMLKCPVNVSDLVRVCREHLRLDAGSKDDDGAQVSSGVEHLPPLMYAREELVKFAAISTSVKCECPQHLADIILGLDAFELYSLECENLSAEDAALHAYLHSSTAKARSLMEKALKRVVEAEGLDVSSSSEG